MAMHIRYPFSGLFALLLAFSASAADQPAAPANPPKTNTASSQQPRPGDGVRVEETESAPLVAVKGADGRITVQHSSDTSEQQKKEQAR